MKQVESLSNTRIGNTHLFSEINAGIVASKTWEYIQIVKLGLSGAPKQHKISKSASEQLFGIIKLFFKSNILHSFH